MCKGRAWQLQRRAWRGREGGGGLILMGWLMKRKSSSRRFSRGWHQSLSTPRAKVEGAQTVGRALVPSLD